MALAACPAVPLELVEITRIGTRKTRIGHSLRCPFLSAYCFVTTVVPTSLLAVLNGDSSFVPTGKQFDISVAHDGFRKFVGIWREAYKEKFSMLKSKFRMKKTHGLRKQ
jgi:hypothetical protein